MVKWAVRGEATYHWGQQMKVTLALLADYANVSIDGKLNIMGIFDTIGALSVPVTHPQMRLVVRFQADPTDRGSTKNIEYKLLDADGNVRWAYAQTIQIPQELPLRAEFPQIVTLNGMTFDNFGDYAFHTVVNGEPKAEVSFHVVMPPNVQPNVQQGA